MLLIGLLLLGAMLVGIGVTFWFWYQTLNEEVGPALIATVFTVMVFVLLAAGFLAFQDGGVDVDDSALRGERTLEATLSCTPLGLPCHLPRQWSPIA